MTEEPKQDTEDTDTDANAEDEGEDAREDADDGAHLDLTSRRLCPDGACIGVIGPDGRCKVCGTPYDGKDAGADPAGDKGEEAEEAEEDEEPRPADDGEDEEPRPADHGELDLTSRKLCSDGECIGVIGPDGRCKACGKPYTGEPTLD